MQHSSSNHVQQGSSSQPPSSSTSSSQYQISLQNTNSEASHPNGNLASEDHHHSDTSSLSRPIPSSPSPSFPSVVIKNPYDTPTDENENSFSEQVKRINVPKMTGQHHHPLLEHVDTNVPTATQQHQESSSVHTAGTASAKLGDDKFSTKHTMTASTPTNSPFVRGNDFEQSGFHFGVPGTPSDSFRRRPVLNVTTVNPPNAQHRTNQIILEPISNTTAIGSSHEDKHSQSFTKKGSIKINRAQNKNAETASPMKIGDDELKPFGTEITVDDDAYSTEEEALVDTAPPLEHDDQSFRGNDTTPTFLRPSESMESISSLAMDPTYQPEILSDESMKKYIENELTAGGTSVIGHLLKSAHDAATNIEKKTGMSLKERIPHVFSSSSLEHQTKPFKFLKGSGDTAAPILLPSQKRTLRSWFLKRSRNTMRFKKKEQKWRKENSKYIEDGDMEAGDNDFKFENDSTTSDMEDDTAPIEVERTQTWQEKVIASFKWFFTGKIEKVQSKILYKDLSDEDRKKVHSLLIDLAYALSIYGLSTNQTEFRLTLISTYYGIDAYFSCTPSGIWIAFGHRPNASNDNMFTYFVKIESQAVNMDKLTKLDKVASNISHGHYTIDDAQKAVNEIIRQPNIYAHPMIALFFHFITPGLFVILWKGNVAEVFTCLIVGLIIGVLNYFCSSMPFFASILPAVASVLGGLIGILMKWILFDYYYISVALCGLCTSYQFLPGSIITTSLQEISIGASLSGITRLTNAFSIILKLGFGLIFTAGIVHQIPKLSESESNDITRQPLAIWARILVVLLLTTVTMISRKVPQHLPTMITIAITSLTAHLINYFLSFLHIEISTAIAATVVGLLANLYTVISHTPPVVVAGVSVLMLSPGSLSYRGMASFILTSNTQSSLTFFLDVFLIGVAIFVGLMVSNHVIPIRQKINI
ncbi:hypothetical protein C9374_010328 [Naegleria lovaniensis]|uniref:Threonine/serine exporter-like N-terminal domain-containing protein n=1 Tax=Naegleria lovaniensis TaxID=51637 RepID=A0AA88GI20_NAELO|nr:uncharacterized protein C9374_010328 [Naegleria lovaniensis]KAG2374954.1 hypothetical protein C9374_010328 [Naegleria lovaniensis]